jgi:hypothetical protein
MEAADSSETLVTVDEASQFYIPHDSNLHSYWWDKHSFRKVQIMSICDGDEEMASFMTMRNITLWTWSVANHSLTHSLTQWNSPSLEIDGWPPYEEITHA